MNCRDIEPLIYLHRKGERTAEEEKQVQGHLAACDACRELAESLIVMNDYLHRTSYIVHRTSIIPPVPKVPIVPIIRAIAAGILLLMAIAFAADEIKFYHERRSLEAKIEKNMIPSGETDCIMKIERKIKTRNFALFSRTDSMKINLIDENALSQYVSEQCGDNPEDIKTIRKILIQAGMINPNIPNEKKN